MHASQGSLWRTRPVTHGRSRTVLAMATACLRPCAVCHLSCLRVYGVISVRPLVQVMRIYFCSMRASYGYLNTMETLECFGSPPYHCCRPAFRQVGDYIICQCFGAPASAGSSLIT